MTRGSRRNTVCEFRYLLMVSLSLLLVGCDDQSPERSPDEQIARWYTPEQASEGELVFAAHCAECHGADAQGLVSDWRQRLADDSFPPPPLNGTAHAWHHPRSVLLQVINEGGAQFGGKMPAFADVLPEADKLAAIAYFQSYWSDEIYSQWLLMGGTD